MIQATNQVEIIEDGITLRGEAWIVPEDFEDDDEEHGLLEYRKGATPSELPSLLSPNMG